MVARSKEAVLAVIVIYRRCKRGFDPEGRMTAAGNRPGDTRGVRAERIRRTNEENLAREERRQRRERDQNSRETRAKQADVALNDIAISVGDTASLAKSTPLKNTEEQKLMRTVDREADGNVKVSTVEKEEGQMPNTKRVETERRDEDSSKAPSSKRKSKRRSNERHGRSGRSQGSRGAHSQKSSRPHRDDGHHSAKGSKKKKRRHHSRGEKK